MGDIQVWKVVCDGLLVASLIYLCYRFARSSAGGGYPHGAVLEAQLRGLLKEADQAARLLNEKLLKRQSKLEELLFDLETVESRINRSINSFDEAKGDLDLKIQKAHKTVQNLADEISRIPRQRQAPAAAETTGLSGRIASHGERPDYRAERETLSLQVPLQATSERTAAEDAPRPGALEPQSIDPIFEPPSFDGPKTQTSAPVPGDRRAESRWSNVNIYGEPITPSQPAVARAQPLPRPVPARKSLAAMVEKEVQHPYAARSEKAENTLQRVYDAAESMLRSGRTLESVCEMTSLPIEEVRMLSQMVAQEDRSAEAPVSPQNDSRLGVLGTMRREIQTL